MDPILPLLGLAALVIFMFTGSDAKASTPGGGGGGLADDDQPRTCQELYDEALALKAETGSGWPNALRLAAEMMRNDEPFKSEGCGDMPNRLERLADDYENAGGGGEGVDCPQVYQQAIADMNAAADRTETIQRAEYWLDAMEKAGCAGSPSYNSLRGALNILYSQ